ncbi:M-phase inducer phosphatase 1-like [Xyrauchen texanus]|uniref:M-phase inducer phosphatase 1-like n=1 Tax=Xyrauchen texanus TaxID=154827 RepID=UPI002241F6BD|nr:M-phase inducer phosphatase 1-like [Xyrauchen texanus]
MEFDSVRGDISPESDLISTGPESVLRLHILTLPEVGTRGSPCMQSIASPGPMALLSPVTNLALNMNNLAGLGSECETPKRKKRWPILKIPSFASDASSDAGLGLDSPSSLDFQDAEQKFERAMLDASRVVNEKMPIRRINSLPLPLSGLSPNLKNKECDASRYGVWTHAHCTANKENVAEENFEFKKPSMPASRCRIRSTSGAKEAFACRPNSAPVLMHSPPSSLQFDYPDESSPSIRRHPFLSCLHDDDDDGFLEGLDDVENDSEVPLGMDSLLTAPLVAKQSMDSTDLPVIRCRPRGLFRSPSMPSPVGRVPLKRPERPQDENTPVRVKRRRSLAGTRVSPAEQGDAMPHQVQRSKSFNHSHIERLLDTDPSNVIGDFTKPPALPTVDGKYQELKYITPEIVVQAMNGQYSDLVERLFVIDCRYPYEYEGGHIKGALNLHQEDQIEDYFLRHPILPVCPGKRVLLVFHCEFSYKRGPRMCRYIRKRDRDLNEYPNLHYPELYILKGGYNEFFPLHESVCEPQAYTRMIHKDFKEDLRKFRLKSCTWAGERSKRDMFSHLK